MLPISYLPAARRDFDESFDWYAQRSEIAAERFAFAVDAAIVRIARSSETFARIDAVYQECPVKRFPFRIIFRKLEERLLVVAIAHAKRRPGYWRT